MRSQEFLGICQRRLAHFRARKHACHLVNPTGVGELLHCSGRVGTVIRLGDMEVGVCKARDLRQMRHAQDLALLRKPTEPAPDRLGHAAAYSGVDLVEDVCPAMLGSYGGGLQHGLERERDSGEFAT